MKAIRSLSRGGAHVDERLIIAAAGDHGSMSGWSAKQRIHLLGCDRCRSLLDKHEELAATLGGEWGQRQIPGVAQSPCRVPVRRLRLVLSGLGAVALAVTVAGSWWALRAGPSATQASPSFALHAVNPGGTSVDFDACVTPAQSYGRNQPDWGEGYLQGARLYLNFTGQPEEHVAALRALLPSDCAVYVRIVPVSSAVGRALESQITDNMATLQAAGVPVNSVGFDPVSDRVTVGIYPLTSQVRTELELRYPASMLDIVEQTPPVPAGS
jgi:hypothetical protein